MSDSGKPLAVVAVTLILLGIGFYVGVAVESSDEPEHTASEALQAAEIGDPVRGRTLFVSQGCAMCHQYQGRGGTDAPPLDFMMGELDATDVAAMSGSVWNHVPAMEAAFEEEGIPFPSFEPGEMEDLVAYLHGGGPPPDVEEIHGEVHEEVHGEVSKDVHGAGMK